MTQKVDIYGITSRGLRVFCGSISVNGDAGLDGLRESCARGVSDGATLYTSLGVYRMDGFIGFQFVRQE